MKRVLPKVKSLQALQERDLLFFDTLLQDELSIKIQKLQGGFANVGDRPPDTVFLLSHELRWQDMVALLVQRLRELPLKRKQPGK